MMSAANVPPSSLWQKAVEEIISADTGGHSSKVATEVIKLRDQLQQQQQNQGCQTIAQTLSARVEKCQTALDNRRWSFKMGKRVIKIRECFNIILKGAQAVQEIGNALASLEPIYAGIPWACVNVLINATTGNFEQHEDVADLMASLAPIIARYTRIEAIYVHGQRKSLIIEFADLLIDLYKQILTAQVEMILFYSRTSTGRFFTSIIPKHDWQGILQGIRAQDGTCRTFASIFDAEDAEDHATQLRTMLRNQDDRMNEILHLHQNTQLVERANKIRAILSWLSPMNPGNDHGTVLDKSKTGSSFRDAGQWLFDDNRYKDWQDESNPIKCLWLRGFLGTGKTTLTSLIIERLLDTVDEHQRIAFFYCVRDKVSQGGMPFKTVLRGLLRGLAFSIGYKDVTRHVETAFDEGQKGGGLKEYITDDMCRDLLVENTKSFSTTYIIIDALDECAQVETLLDNLCSIQDSNSPKVKICLSSRLGVSPHEFFPQASVIEVGADSTQADMRRFIEETIKTARPRILDGTRPDLEDRIIALLCAHANGMFKWADLHIAALLHRRNRGSAARIEAYLAWVSQSVTFSHYQSSGLDKQYRTIYELNIGETEIDRQRAQAAFRIVLCAARPLSIDELVTACQYHESGTGSAEIDANYILEIIAANFLIKGRDNKVSFAHVSANDYLRRCYKELYASEVCHLAAANACIAAMTDLSVEALPNGRVVSVPFLEYAYQRWTWHCSRSKQHNITNSELVIRLNELLGNAGPGTAFDRYRTRVRYNPSLHTLPEGAIIRPFYAAPMITSCIWGFEATIQLLAEQEPDRISRKDTIGWYPIHLASAFGRVEAVRYLVKKRPEFVEWTQSSSGITPLHLAACCGRIEVLEALLEAGADVNAKALNGAQAIHFASSLTLTDPVGNREDLEPPNKYSFAGQSAARRYQGVITASHLKVLDLLLVKGAYVDAEDLAEQQPFFYSAYSGIVEIGQWLLAKGADKRGFKQDRAGSALSAAVLNKHASFVTFLLQQGVAVDGTRKSGATPLHLAVLEADVKIAQTLLQAGADVERRATIEEEWEKDTAYAGETPLTLAISLFKDDRRMIELLLNHGAKADTVDKEGKTVEQRVMCDIESQSRGRIFVYPLQMRGRRARPPLVDWRGLLRWFLLKRMWRVMVPELPDWKSREVRVGHGRRALATRWWEI